MNSTREGHREALQLDELHQKVDREVARIWGPRFRLRLVGPVAQGARWNGFIAPYQDGWLPSHHAWHVAGASELEILTVAEVKLLATPTPVRAHGVWDGTTATIGTLRDDVLVLVLAQMFHARKPTGALAALVFGWVVEAMIVLASPASGAALGLASATLWDNSQERPMASDGETVMALFNEVTRRLVQRAVEVAPQGTSVVECKAVFERASAVERAIESMAGQSPKDGGP